MLINAITPIRVYNASKQCTSNKPLQTVWLMLQRPQQGDMVGVYAKASALLGSLFRSVFIAWEWEWDCATTRSPAVPFAGSCY